jgi:hypothetical protein
VSSRARTRTTRGGAAHRIVFVRHRHRHRHRRGVCLCKPCSVARRGVATLRSTDWSLARLARTLDAFVLTQRVLFWRHEDALEPDVSIHEPPGQGQRLLHLRASGCASSPREYIRGEPPTCMYKRENVRVGATCQPPPPSEESWGRNGVERDCRSIPSSGDARHWVVTRWTGRVSFVSTSSHRKHRVLGSRVGGSGAGSVCREFSRGLRNTPNIHKPVDACVPPPQVMRGRQRISGSPRSSAAATRCVCVS